MLRTLRSQIISLNAPRQTAHIFFVYDRNIVDATLVQKVIDDEFGPDNVPAVTRIIPTDGMRYYDQKNFGAAQADVEVNIFLDCDVIPEPGWLSAILEAFKNPDVGVVAGKCPDGRIRLVSGNHGHKVGTGCYAAGKAIAWRLPS